MIIEEDAKEERDAWETEFAAFSDYLRIIKLQSQSLSHIMHTVFSFHLNSLSWDEMNVYKYKFNFKNL